MWGLNVKVMKGVLSMEGWEITAGHHAEVKAQGRCATAFATRAVWWSVTCILVQCCCEVVFYVFLLCKHTHMNVSLTRWPPQSHHVSVTFVTQRTFPSTLVQPQAVCRTWDAGEQQGQSSSNTLDAAALSFVSRNIKGLSVFLLRCEMTLSSYNSVSESNNWHLRM